MQISNPPVKLVLPFGANDPTGRATIPVTTSSPGYASLNSGFPPITRTPKAAGGIPPRGVDMNGILYAISAISRWSAAGAGYEYDSTFANDPNVAGYPAGARVLRADGLGYWRNLTDGNTTDPDAGGAGWTADNSVPMAFVNLTTSTTTLTATEAAADIIVLSGTLTENVNLVFPIWQKMWTVVNNTSGAFTVTCKTASGTGFASIGGSRATIYGDGINILSVESLVRGESGGCTLSNGLELRWATVTRVGTGLVTYSLPFAFSREAFNAVAIPTSVDGTADMAVNSVSLTQIVIEYDAATNVNGVRYLAWGR